MQKNIFLTIISVLFFTACQNKEDILQDQAVGYLRLEVGADKTTITKAEEVYNPKQIAVKIINEAGETIKETDDYTTWTDAIALTPGKYKISASSAGFDGTTAAWDKPYYAGLDSVTIVKGESVSKTVTCTLANVLVTVEFDSEFKKAFKSATVVVTDTVTASNKVTFMMNETTERGKAYFPVTGLFADLAVTNQKDKIFSKKDTVEDVKARENVILRYKLGESSTGSTNIDITLDGTTKTYIYTIGVPLTATTTIVASEANAWSKFAYLNAEVPSFAGVFDQSKLSFEYRKSDAPGWTRSTEKLIVDENNKNFTTRIVNLEPATNYQYRVVYGEEEFISDTIDFETEIAQPLPNGQLDDWYKSGKSWYAVSEMDFSNNLFWDSGNGGANTLKEVNPTRPEDSDVKSGRAALLASTTAANQFAAGSLFTGKFIKATIIPLGANLEFGRPYTSRPLQLKGYYKYNPGLVTHTKKDFIHNGDRDSCSIYIALTTWNEPFQVSTGDNKFVNFNDNSIIAYGELNKAEMSPESMSDYKSFTINLRYRNLEVKPQYILIVCSSSKYGDYFTGSTDSKLLVDELELIYDGEPTLWK